MTDLGISPANYIGERWKIFLVLGLAYVYMRAEIVKFLDIYASVSKVPTCMVGSMMCVYLLPLLPWVIKHQLINIGWNIKLEEV